MEVNRVIEKQKILRNLVRDHQTYSAIKKHILSDNAHVREAREYYENLCEKIKKIEKKFDEILK